MENGTEAPCPYSTFYSNGRDSSSVQGSKHHDDDALSDRASNDGALFAKFEVPSFEEGEVEMVPVSVSGALFGGWRFPWTRSTSWDQSEIIDNRPSNESLLSIAFVSFMGFTICQTVAAIIAGSEAMMGDSAAMFVDALTYLFNWVAERRKKQCDEGSVAVGPDVEPERALRIRKRAKRKMTLQLELVPPLISVSTLVVVIAFVLRKAIRVLLLDLHRDRSKQANPNLELMFFFSMVNLLLDMFNVFCFAKANHALGYETTNEPIVGNGNSPRALSRNRNYVTLGEGDLEEEFEESNGQDPERISGDPKMKQHTIQDRETNIEPAEMNGTHQNGHASPEIATSCVPDEEDENEEGNANLNMCSAYTHVFADTLRSIAVVIAAILAELVDGVTPEEADATAAVVVSGLILLSLIPLIHGLIQTFSELRAIRAEEKSELMFPQGAEQTLYRMTTREGQGDSAS